MPAVTFTSEQRITVVESCVAAQAKTGVTQDVLIAYCKCLADRLFPELSIAETDALVKAQTMKVQPPDDVFQKMLKVGEACAREIQK